MCQPAPPDYAAAATAQGQANVTAAQAQAGLNNPNVNSPYGTQSVSYSTDQYGNMVPTIDQSLTPQGQQDLQNQQQVQGGESQLALQGLGTAQSVLGTPFQFNGPGIQTSLGNYGQASAGNAAQGSLNMSGVAPAAINPGQTAYQAQMALLQPQIAQSGAALQQQLANQGITAGSQAYTNATNAWGQQTGALEDNAALQGVGLQQSANQQGYNQALGNAGLYNQAAAQNYGQNLGAQAQNFSEGLQGAQFGNTAQQQALAQQLGLYNQPLNEITALMSGSQIQNPQFQQYSGGGNVGAAPVMTAATDQGNYNTAAYNSQAQGLGGLFGGIGSAAGGFFGSPAGSAALLGFL